MKITHGSQLEYEPVSLSHRGTGLGFKHLAVGDPDDIPNNFWFTLGKQRDFYSPIHKHNFDQFRYAYSGRFNLTDRLNLEEGHLAYHPEGVEYGPQNDGPEERILLVLQCGGASGQGYIHHAQLKKANEELSKSGKFEKGKYIAEDGTTKDGFQALWELTTGRTLEYPKGRYQEPVIIDPEAFAWKPTAQKSQQANGANGHGHHAAKAFRRTYGVFSERELRAEAIKVLEGGCVTVGGGDAIHLLFVLSGAGTVDSEQLEKESTIKLEPGDYTEIRCDGSELEMLHFVLPLVD